MKRLRILFSIVLVFVISIAIAQNKETNVMKVLTSSTWEHTYEPQKNVKIESEYTFTKNKFTEIATYGGKSGEISQIYYLSDKPEFEFDNSKVGKSKNGKYIITKNKFSKVFVKKIITLTDTIFEFSLISKPSSGRNNQDDQTIVCKGIPKR